ALSEGSRWRFVVDNPTGRREHVAEVQQPPSLMCAWQIVAAKTASQVACRVQDECFNKRGARLCAEPRAVPLINECRCARNNRSRVAGTGRPRVQRLSDREILIADS